MICQNYLEEQTNTVFHYDSYIKKFKSPAGIIYNHHDDINYANRVLHVMEHSQEMNKISGKSLFRVSKEEILPLIDEAWSMRGHPLPYPSAQNHLNDNYIIDFAKLNRIIGLDNQETKLIISVRKGTSELVTSYPSK